MELGALAALRVVERVVFGWGLFAATDDVSRGVVLVVGAGLVHVARALVTTRARIRLRIQVEKRAAAAVLAVDPVAPLAVGGDDPFVAFHQGVEANVRLIVDLLPAGAGDAVASVVLALVLVGAVRRFDFALFAAAALLGGAIAFGVRRSTGRMGKAAWSTKLPVWFQLRSIVGARDELVASGTTEDAEAELARRLGAWALSEQRYQMLAGLSGRLPFLAAGALVMLGFVARAQGSLSGDLWRQCLCFAGAVAPLAGFLATVHEIGKSERETAALVEMMAAARVQREALARRVSPLRDAPSRPRAVVGRGVAYRYPGASVDSVRSVDFTWTVGRLLAVTGDNGAGKSTLIRLLLRLAEPTSGSFVIDGVPVTSIELIAWRRSFAYVSQAPYLDEDATVRDFFRLLAVHTDEVRIRTALERVGLWERLQRAPAPLEVRMRTLSAGQKQRAVIARAIVQDRPMLLLDEPDASLDAAGIELLIALLRELATDRMVAVVAHSPALVAAADDRLLLTAAAAAS